MAPIVGAITHLRASYLSLSLEGIKNSIKTRFKRLPHYTVHQTCAFYDSIPTWKTIPQNSKYLRLLDKIKIKYIKTHEDIAEKTHLKISGINVEVDY